MPYYLGVDGGATKSKVVIGNEQGLIVGQAEGPPSNYLLIGLEKALEAIKSTIEEASSQASISSKDLDGAVFGLAGADLPAHFIELSSGLKDVYPGLPLKVVNDTWVALRGGIKKGWGVALVCGTGANACLKTPKSKWFTLRGLGYETGFEGGALSMVKDILHHSFRSHDGLGPKTLLEKEVLITVGLNNYDELSELVFGFFLFPSFTRPEVRSLLNLIPWLFVFANDGDYIAQTILIKHGEELGKIAGKLINKAGLEKEEVEVVLVGGVFRGNNPTLIDKLTLSLHLSAPLARIVFPEFDPAIGGYLLALENSNIPITEDVYRKLSTKEPII
ncbi:MAG: N-acetylmuramic acid/N-acetylglucosamine kinase [candidate division WS2 bacterium]|nr:N-acetylmuramic acid/N-acetylglucosamine kinase [Candidatus Psychracetigena formicireducens]